MQFLHNNHACIYLQRTPRSNTDSGHTWINRRSIRACFFLSFNSKVVLQQGEEMIYVDLISPLWWQRYDQMINGQPEKQELSMWPLGMHLIRSKRTNTFHWNDPLWHFHPFLFLFCLWPRAHSLPHSVLKSLQLHANVHTGHLFLEEYEGKKSHSLQELLLSYTYCSLLLWCLLKC